MAEDNKKKTIFGQILEAGDVALQRYIAKGRSEIQEFASPAPEKLLKSRSEIGEEEDDAFYRKSVYRDMNYQVSSQGYLDRGTKIGYSHLKQMSVKDTIVAAIIQYYQNEVAKRSKPAKGKLEIGFKIRLKDEEQYLEDIKTELFGEHDREDDLSSEETKDSEDLSAENEEVLKAEMPEEGQDQPPGQEAPEEGAAESEEQDKVDAEESHIKTDKEKSRLAKEELRKRTKDKIKALTDFISNCGHLEDRPFESRKWNFDAWLRATVRDSLTYDQYATEFVPQEDGKIHHFVPVDGATIRLTTPEFHQYNKEQFQSGYDILYPEKELEALKEQRDAFELDPEKVEHDDYKFVQVVRGRIQRAFTADELSLGMRNPMSDIYANGYSLSELELLVGAVSSHIFTENYNNSYFSQGFSAKGILHIKSPLNRRKLETIRLQWRHMMSGARNSFQTPIMAGMDEVQWIPLTQSHADMEFNNWMNYLIKIICSIYQVDPAEIGFGMREEGGRGGGLSGGSNLETKLEQSKSKGLYPLLRHIENFINKNIIDRIDAEYCLEFTGLNEESPMEAVSRQEKEVKFKKSVNEIREEDGLPPIPGADDLILDPNYMQWFTQFHPEGKKIKEQQMISQGLSFPSEGEGVENNANEEAAANAGESDVTQKMSQAMKKSKEAKTVAIEFCEIKE